jgi:hypothetical protein
MKRKILRTLEQVIDDPLWPSQGLIPDPAASLRHRAIVNILVRLPEDAYVKLTEKADEFSWFIPDMIHGGMVMPFPCTIPEESLGGGVRRVAHAKVLYLSPGLEQCSFDVAVASVAHELAHIFLNHDLWPEDPGKQEDEAWQTVIAWGFKTEERAHKKFYQRLHSRERALVKRLMRSTPKRRRRS